MVVRHGAARCELRGVVVLILPPFSGAPDRLQGAVRWRLGFFGRPGVGFHCQEGVYRWVLGSLLKNSSKAGTYCP